MKRQIAAVILTAALFSPFEARVQETAPVIPPANKSAVILDQNKFQSWLIDFKKEAVTKGVSQKTVDKGLEGIKPIPRIIELDRKQPEFTKTFAQYIESVVPHSRIKKGRMEYQRNKQLLDEISQKYGVQARFIVALWGIETDFGTKTGGYYIPEALATLAFDGRRSAFFRDELINSLRILDSDHITVAQMRGSWAGAMGQTQFMPSSFLSYAQDYNGDGKRDIWDTKADVFASIANYLKNVGWNGQMTWGRKVKLPQNFDETWRGQDKKLSEWQSLGVRNPDGSDLPQKDLVAMLSLPGGKSGDAFLVYENYKRILKWNRSDYFATAVGYLSDGIR